MWLIVRQLPIKAEWGDAPLLLWDFSRRNKRRLSTNVTISLYSDPHFHQSILPILSCGVKLISYSQLFSSSDAKGFFVIAFWGSTLNGFSVFICLIISSSTFEELLALEKNFSNLFPYRSLLTLSACLNTLAQYSFCTYFF